MNEKTLNALEYHKIIEKLASLAGSNLGKEMCRQLKPSIDLQQINMWQEECSGALTRIYRNGSISFSGVQDITESLRRVVIGSCLTAGELLAIGSLLSCTKNVYLYGKKVDDDYTDCLDSFFQRLEPISALQKEIERCILAEDEFADDASPSLKHIRRSIKNANEKITSVLNQTLSSSEVRLMLQEHVITMRNDRYCLPVKAEYRNRFQGMIHDQSATGSTLFIEPMSVVKLNNDIKELYLQENEEIERILAVLSSMVNEHADTLELNLNLLQQLDFIFARGLLSKAYQCSQPIFNDEGIIHIKKGRHLLLDQKTVVPVDIRLGEQYTMLIVTGPNTGGKTVALKTAGLLTLMGQSGLHIPAFDGSRLALFENIFADIGDEQSIEQNLSTFSSHMTNIVRILNQVTERSLVLFDELGSGTDPTEGAALAMSILSHLHDMKIRTMATTHYSELKVFALSTEGIENGCCEFNVDTLQPTYRLLIGIPGKSNAFAISGKLGLSSDLIQAARQFISSDKTDFEDLISDLEANRKTIEKEQVQIEQYKQEITELKNKTAKANEKLEHQKERIISQAKEKAAAILQEAKDYADTSIKNINQLAKDSHIDMSALEKQRQSLGKQVKKNYTNIHQSTASEQSQKIDVKKIKIGDAVHVLSLNLDGTISSLPNAKGDCFVQMGILRSQININDMVLREEVVVTAPHMTRTNKGKISMSKSAHIEPTINLLGKTVDEALHTLDKYLDDAYLAHLPQVTIVHGKGTGALRTAVQDFLRRSKNIKAYRNGEFGEGEMGVTIATFKS